MKLTKMQVKNNDRINHWLQEKPFRETGTAIADIPGMTAERVLAEYTPPNPEYTAQYFTPLETAEFVAGYVTGEDILDPCAGIGSLLHPIYNCGFNLYAWEMDMQSYLIGGKCFPDIHWELGNAFELIDKLNDYDNYDQVVINPPFGIQWGLSSTDRWSISGAKRSEHLFMELAIRATVPGGSILAILPSTFLTSLPKKFSEWFHNEVCVDESWLLKAEFKFTKIATHLFHITRREF